jgi:hypothetical protein
MTGKPKRGLLRHKRRAGLPVARGALPAVAPRIEMPDYRPILIPSAMPEREHMDMPRAAVYPFRAKKETPGTVGGQLNKYDSQGNLLTTDGPVSINVIAFSAGTSSAMALDTNLARRLLVIQNNGADFIVVNFGTAAALTLGLKIAAGQGYEFPIVTTQSIFIIGNSAGLAVIIMEGV